MKKRIYVAGPMTGHKELNFPAFHAAAAALRAEGHHVENPAEINADPNAQWLDCMRMDIARLVTCDAVYMLPGWEASRGARLEHTIAAGLGLEVMHAPTVAPEVTDVDIEVAREFLADVHNATQMRSALGQLRAEVVIELATRGIVPDYYAAPQKREVEQDEGRANA